MKIIKDEKVLKKICDIVSLNDGYKISRKLINKLETHNKEKRKSGGILGIGLSAPQIGIFKKVCVIWVNYSQDPIILINPRIISRSNEEFLSEEGCLSLLGKIVILNRWRWVTVECDNNIEQKTFGSPIPYVLNRIIEKDQLIESAAVQHEIDHLNGILITDYKNV